MEVESTAKQNDVVQQRLTDDSGKVIHEEENRNIDNTDKESSSYFISTENVNDKLSDMETYNKDYDDECKTDSMEKKVEDDDASNTVQTPQPPLVFTIDFGNNKEVDKVKYQNLFERYNARHKRNLSTSKVEVGGKKGSALMSPNLVQKQKIPSTHSEGYFSSEDDLRLVKRKTDSLTEKLKQLSTKCIHRTHSLSKKSDIDFKLRDAKNKQELMTRSCDDQTKDPKLARQNLSLELDYGTKSNNKVFWTSQKSATINDLSHVEACNYDDDSNEKSYTKNIEYIAGDNEYDDDEENYYKTSMNSYSQKASNINYSINDYNLENPNPNDSNLSSSVSCNMDLNISNVKEDTNLDVFNVSNVDAGSDDGAVSEAGTYTIHKDYTDEEKARMDIDKVFSVGVLTEEENNESYVHNFQMSISRDNNTWISEWATQVAEHNSLPPAIGGPTGRTPPLSPSKIPSPIHSKSPRMARYRYEPSDNSSMDALRIKERIDLISNQQLLIDSGGESDEDTSNSYNTPPHSSQRTPVHNSLGRRSSLSESLFRRANTNDNRRSVRKYYNSDKSKTEDGGTELLKSPSRTLASLYLGRRSSSLDRKDYTSDTTESNTSRKNSMKYSSTKDDSKHTNSPVLNRLRPSTPKLTNSPIVSRKTSSMKIINSPMLERAKHLTKSTPQAKNIGYFTCVENSPYMLRKSNSATNYHERSSIHNKEISISSGIPRNCLELQRQLNIQRSSSNASIGNFKSQAVVSRHSSFNSSDVDRISARNRFLVASDSSSETGEQQSKSPIHPISSGIKLNRAFSIRRARLNCESDTTPNTTPEERRRKAQTDVKITSINKQQNYQRGRTSSVGAFSKDSLKTSEPSKTRTPSISRNDAGRVSIRAPKSSYHGPIGQRNAQKPNKETKNSGRSNSTLTSKEVEFQNWKRRKSYDPMKAAAEGRKKLVDGSKKHHSTEDSSGNHDNSVLRSASFHGTGGTLSLANEWSDNELNYSQDENQEPTPCSLQLGSDSDLETSSYLQTTQNVVSAMSARMVVYHPSLADSDNESDEDTSQSLHQNTSKVTRQPSDTETSDEQHVIQPPISNTKYNRAFSLRRARLEPQPSKTINSSITKPKVVQETRAKIEPNTSINRTDSGRFSMRANRVSSAGLKGKPKETKKPVTPNAREVEMQNWKRRKSYDPMKAAMEGRKKASLSKKSTTNANLSPRTDSDR
ncbi:PREDICTED: dentin sialophosphoprotein isoform X2 [Polistes dominula]|uniref:Dentin sialophosphoprotein isoform X2 n=1 Tax=Polistes dominula TaxID=743375 RepID=A0ABM1IUD7_POLDO|nr:PREDICTED: dentin sialophosphoprotein isoform X2 [Polistes dominula]